MKTYLLPLLIALVLGAAIGANIKDTQAFHNIPNQHNYCPVGWCWWWERVADGGTSWTKYGDIENRWAIDWEDGYCHNIDPGCPSSSPNHMHWLKNANTETDGHYALWDHVGEAESGSVTKVFIWIPDVHATTTEGRYNTLFNWGSSPYTVDQSSYSDEWVLGDEDFYGQRTFLEGFTNEPRNSVDIGFDEIQQSYYH
jgi:hypothetical protein